jgi:hypothetical protein
LNGQSDFSGGVTIDDGELIVDSDRGLGTGDVEVRGGSLTLKRAALADHASLRLFEGLQDGAVRLEFSGSDVANTLYMGDTEHRCGTWGAPGSGAMFTDDVFSGTGVLQLAAAPMEGCAAKTD